MKNDPSLIFKKKEIFDKPNNKTRNEIHNLSKEISYNDLTYYFKIKESSPKYFTGFRFLYIFQEICGWWISARKKQTKRV